MDILSIYLACPNKMKVAGNVHEMAENARCQSVTINTGSYAATYSMGILYSGVGTRGAGGAAAPLYFWWAILQYWHFLINFA